MSSRSEVFQAWLRGDAPNVRGDASGIACKIHAQYEEQQLNTLYVIYLMQVLDKRDASYATAVLSRARQAALCMYEEDRVDDFVRLREQIDYVAAHCQAAERALAEAGRPSETCVCW